MRQDAKLAALSLKPSNNCATQLYVACGDKGIAQLLHTAANPRRPLFLGCWLCQILCWPGRDYADHGSDLWLETTTRHFNQIGGGLGTLETQHTSLSKLSQGNNEQSLCHTAVQPANASFNEVVAWLRRTANPPKPHHPGCYLCQLLCWPGSGAACCE